VWVRISAFLLGIIALIWLSIEDVNVSGVAILSGAICLWTALWIMIRPVGGGKMIILRHSLVGMGAGFAIAPLAILLMALKSGLHGHGFPDFTVAQMQEVLSRTPYFAFSGLLIGLGSGVLRFARWQEQTLGG
jgi:hypothetical protein